MDALILLIGAYMAFQYTQLEVPQHRHQRPSLLTMLIDLFVFFIAIILFSIAIIPVAGRIIWPTPF